MKKTLSVLAMSIALSSTLYAVDCEQAYKVQSFAERFYTTVLERQPDNLGLDGWTNDLTSRRKTGTDVANGFIFSEEFVSKDKSDEEFVTIMYRAFFDRPASGDMDGYNYWLGKLTAGEERTFVSHGFLYSQEFAKLSVSYGIQAYEGATFTTTALDNFVKRFYSVILGRDADSAGLKSWTDRLSTKEMTGSNIAFGFILSAEYDMPSKTDTEYLNTLYSAFFNRAADTEGLNGWMIELTNGITREEVLDGFLHSQEFINLTNSFGILAFEGAPTAGLSNNVAPTANAGVDQSVNFGDNVIVDASASIDPDGTIECYWWKTQYGLIDTTIQVSSSDIEVGVTDIRLTVVDDAGVSHSDSVKITVQDTPPAFTSNSTVSVAENQLSALTVLATDVQGSVTYSLSGGDSADFSIDDTTGVIVFNTAPDFETRETYSFTVTATDSSGQSVSQTVTVHITDVSEGQAPKKTGQTKSYNSDGDEVTDNSIRDDGFYQKGTAPSYTRDDATDIVTDHITGLQWADDANVSNSSMKKQWLTDTNYDICDNNHSAPECYDTSGDTATTYCETLELGGYSDWRLPTIDELMNIADRSKRNPAIDTTAFQNVVSYFYWSSTTFVGNEDLAWGVRFSYGYAYWYYKSNSRYVRCVRDGQ